MKWVMQIIGASIRVVASPDSGIVIPGSAISRVEAFDKVEIETDVEKATSDRGVYDVKSGIATLTGSVKIIREGNHLSGCKAEVNMNTGISKMFSCAAQGGGQVGGVFNLGTRKKPKGN